MSRPLRVLLVEDSEDDALLVLRALQTGGFQPEHERVDTPEAMTSALADGSWDVVISDYSMPKFSGVAALALLRKSGLDVSFIVVSGTIGEEIAVGMMRAGAHDYLMKGHLVRLVPAVERELEEAEQRRRQRQAERLLRESEERLRDLFENAHDLIQSVRPDGTFLYVNRAWRETLGYNEAEIPGLSLMRDIVHPSSVPHCLEMFQRLVAGDSLDHVEAVFRTKDGREIIVEGNCNCHFVDGQPDYTRQIFRDVTERARAEEARKLFRALVDQSNDTIEVVDPETGRFLDVNEKGHLALGYSREEFLALSVFDLDPTVKQSEFPRIVEDLRKSGVLMWEGSRRRKDGSTFPVEVSVKYVHLDRDYIVSVVRDITERRRAEAALRESEQIQRLVLDNVDEIVYMVELGTDSLLSGRVRFVSGRVEKILGYQAEEFMRDSELWFSLIHPDDAPALAEHTNEIFASGQPGLREYRVRHKRTGDYHWMEDHVVPQLDAAGRVVSQFGVARDVTERKQLEAQTLRTQRLESIGTLAGGVAHDLNNALAPIIMSAELLRLEFPDAAAEYFELIQAGAKRGADMVKQLLTFARGTEGERLLVQPKHLLKEMEKLITSTFPKNIELRTDYAKDLRSILGDATQLYQVLLNLCVNARDAMPEGGTLTLKAENMEIDTVHARAVPEAKPGHYVVWRVTDTGTGIPPEVLDRIFEPFFSTKGPDKGTGLGLSTVIGIVKSHGGFVKVYSSPGQGSTFTVYLPACGAAAGDTSLLTKTDATFRGHGETILVVDDEEPVRNVLRTVLTKLNFKVLTASDGTAALIQVTEHGAQLRAVITDLHMPHMDGLSFARVLRARSPQTGIIVTSGRLDEREANEFKKLGIYALLEKPFSQEKLVAALKMIFQKSELPREGTRPACSG